MRPHGIDDDYLDALGSLPALDMSDPVGARADRLRMLDELPSPDTAGVGVRDVAVPGPQGAPDVPLRVYTPEGARDPMPAVYHVHGGGFVMGTFRLSHARSVELCRELGAVVVAVDYRLAPEAAFPAGLEDCYAGLCWLFRSASELGVDPARVALHGGSAGGGLAAAIALLARDRGGPQACFQYLTIPELDDRLETASARAFTDTPLWNRRSAELSWDHYLGGPGRRGGDDVSPYAAPARAADLAGLPAAYVDAMEFDPLRDEGIDYALRLLAAGVQVELHVWPGALHASPMVSGAPQMRHRQAEELVVLRRALRPR